VIEETSDFHSKKKVSAKQRVKEKKEGIMVVSKMMVKGGLFHLLSVCSKRVGVIKAPRSVSTFIASQIERRGGQTWGKIHGDGTSEGTKLRMLGRF